MLRQFSFVPAIGKLCRVSSTSTHLSVIISLCRSGYSWRINNKCFSRLSTKCHSTNKFRLHFDKKKRSRKKYCPPLKVQEEENQSLVDQELDQEQHHGSLNQSKVEKEEENQSLADQELDQEQHHGSLNQSKAEKLDWDPFEDLFGVGIDMEPRNITFSRPEPRSWIGPNGQYVKELPCPSCRGRGYMLCTECGIHCSRPSCPQCHGKGLSTCRECLGECVIWEESVDELPWEKAYTSSPINIGEDDAIDKMEIGSTPKRKSKRVYAPTPPDVGAKISRTLKNLNAVTGMFSKKMKKVHSDPILRAQTVEAMKRAKRTPEARQHASNMMTTFFSNPENRLKRSISMKGVKFYCRNCGEEGHRSHYCPSLKHKIGSMRYKCRRCGKTGHNRTTCKQKRKHKSHRRTYNCSVCGQGGHNSKTCPQKDQAKGFSSEHQNQELLNNVNIIKRQTIKCSICWERGHNARSCSRRVKLQNAKAQTNLLK